jgi:Ceramidase
MVWSEQIFRYCERGDHPGLLAEPFNAVSNLAFVAVACIAAWRLQAERPAGATSPGDPGAPRVNGATRGVVRLLILLAALIGAGSFLFHTLATRWAQLADVVPITVFMLLYLAFALRNLLGLHPGMVALGLGAFALALAVAISVCPPAEEALSPACLNGTMAYAPALLAMAAVGLALRGRGHPAAKSLLAASAVFLVAMAMRSADMAACEATRLAGHAVGLHVLWHLLNAVALYPLLMAAVAEANRTPALPG